MIFSKRTGRMYGIKENLNWQNTPKPWEKQKEISLNSDIKLSCEQGAETQIDHMKYLSDTSNWNYWWLHSFLNFSEFTFWCNMFTLETPSKVRPPNFTTEQLSILMDWLESNIDNPYPSKSTIRNLKLWTGLTVKQITLWCTNIRRVKI